MNTELKEIFDNIRKVCFSGTDASVCAASIIYAFDKLESKLDITNKHLELIGKKLSDIESGHRKPGYCGPG